MLKAFLGIEAVLAAAVGVVFLAGTVADNWVPVLAVIGAVTTSAISPVVMSNLNNRAAERRAAQAAAIAQDKEDRDYARQDEVARRQEDAAKNVAKAAVALVESNREVAEKAEIVAEKVSEVADTAASSAVATETKLDVIHALVNGNLTVSMNSQLVALRASRVALTTLADLQESSGKPAFHETRQQVEDVDKAVMVLEGQINERIATEQAQ